MKQLMFLWLVSLLCIGAAAQDPVFDIRNTENITMHTETEMQQWVGEKNPLETPPIWQGVKSKRKRPEINDAGLTAFLFFALKDSLWSQYQVPKTIWLLGRKMTVQYVPQSGDIKNVLVMNIYRRSNGEDKEFYTFSAIPAFNGPFRFSNVYSGDLRENFK